MEPWMAFSIGWATGAGMVCLWFWATSKLTEESEDIRPMAVRNETRDIQS